MIKNSFSKVFKELTEKKMGTSFLIQNSNKKSIQIDLKSREGLIFQLKARAYQREYELFCRLRELVGNKAMEIKSN